MIESLPLGTDYPITQKISWASELFESYGNALLVDRSINTLSVRYLHVIEETWGVMNDVGITAECTDCAVNDNGSCCGQGIEDRFDTALLVVNRLLGCELPTAPLDPQDCWFLGMSGCRLIARHVICVNYLCRRLNDGLRPEGLRRAQEAMAVETDLAFMLEEAVKRWLRQKGPQKGF